MAHQWFQQFAGRFGFPDNYTTIDLETSGLSYEQGALICTCGWTTVRNRQVVETQELVLNWPASNLIDQRQLQEDLGRVEEAMRNQQKTFHHSYAWLQQRGDDPVDVLRRLLDLVESAEARREVLIAHNGWRFDIPFMESHFHHFLGISFVFDPDLVYDSGIMEKAAQLPDDRHPLPAPGETMKQFSLRISEIRAKDVRWALDKHCDERYGLLQRANVSHFDTHRSGTDSLLIHYLIEEHRKLAGLASQLDRSSPGSQAVVYDYEPDS